PADGRRGPPLECGPLRPGLILGPAHRHLPVPRATAAEALEGVEQLLVRRRADDAVGDATGGLGRLLAAGGHVDGRRRVGQRVDPRVLDGVMATVVALASTLPEEPDDADRFLEHLEA